MAKNKLIQEVSFTKEGIEGVTSALKTSLVVHLKEIPEKSELKQFYEHIAESVGYLVRMKIDSIGGVISNDPWTELVFDREKQYLAYKHSYKHHPLHTDYGHLPFHFDYTFFFCERQADVGGSTVFCEPKMLIELLKKYEPILYEQLTTKEVWFEKHPNDLSRTSGRIISFEKGSPIFRWNFHAIKGGNEPDVIEMAKDFHEFLEERIINAGVVHGVCLKPGEALFIDDRRLLHGRHSFFGDRKMFKGAIVTSNVEQVRSVLENIQSNYS